MLQKLNERIQGVVAWLVIVLIAITFTLFGVDYYLQSHQTSNAKVVVNDQALSNQAFETNYRRARAQQDISQMTAADEKKLQNQVLKQMIANEVTMQAARRYGFEVNLDQANAAIVNIPQFQEDGHFSAEKYQQALNGALFTPESFQKEVQQGMLLNQQRFAFIGSSFALPDELDRFVRLYMQTRDYDYVTISAEQLQKQVQISMDEIKDYYKKHQKKFMSPEQVVIDYVTLSTQDIRAKITISPAEIKKYYNENQSNYLTPAQWKVAHILFSVPENASQEDIARIQQKAEDTYKELQQQPDKFDQLVALSDDKLSIPAKGILPELTGGQNEYDKILSHLTTPGQIAPPERTKHGFQIFKLISHKPVSTKALSEVQTAIHDQIANDLVQTQYARTLEQLSDLSYQTPDSLTPITENLKLKIQQSEPFSRAGGTNSLTKNKQIINAAFSHDVLELGNNSDPIQLDNDTMVVLRVNKHLLTKQQSFEKVQERIKQILTKNAAEAKAKELGSHLLSPIEDKQQQELMSQNQLVWHSVTQASRDNDKINSIINDQAFNLLRPESREGINLQNGDYVVVRLKRINDGQLNNLDQEQKSSLIQQIEASYGMMDYELYVKGLINKAKVVNQ